jgi:hypothetical protein
VTLVGDVLSLAPGAQAPIRVTGNGVDFTFPFTVLHSSSSEGMEGFVGDIEFDSPFWRALGGAGTLTYAALGGGRRTLPAAGSAGPLGQFLADCRFFAGTTVATAPVPTLTLTLAPPVAAGNNTCQTMAGVRSENGGQLVVVEFVNRTNEARGVLWVDFDGIPQSYGMLNPGESIGIETWTTHPWMLSDGPGNCIEMYMPSATSSVYDITLPSPGGFGPE